MTVLGIGGIFFRARDPETLTTWYREHLGVGAGCAADGAGAPDEWSWQTRGGPVVFAPFDAGTDYWSAEKQCMVNFRVDDLDTMLDHLCVARIPVRVDPEWDSPEAGRFARIHDPEGNPIELWEPPGAATT